MKKSTVKSTKWPRATLQGESEKIVDDIIYKNNNIVSVHGNSARSAFTLSFEMSFSPINMS